MTFACSAAVSTRRGSAKRSRWQWLSTNRLSGYVLRVPSRRVCGRRSPTSPRVGTPPPINVGERERVCGGHGAVSEHVIGSRIAGEPAPHCAQVGTPICVTASGLGVAEHVPPVARPGIEADVMQGGAPNTATSSQAHRLASRNRPGQAASAQQARAPRRHRYHGRQGAGWIAISRVRSESAPDSQTACIAATLQNPVPCAGFQGRDPCRGFSMSARNQGSEPASCAVWGTRARGRVCSLELRVVDGVQCTPDGQCTTPNTQRTARRPMNRGATLSLQWMQKTFVLPEEGE
jgi:hypothetical protein